MGGGVDKSDRKHECPWCYYFFFFFFKCILQRFSSVVFRHKDFINTIDNGDMKKVAYASHCDVKTQADWRPFHYSMNRFSVVSSKASVCLRKRKRSFRRTLSYYQHAQLWPLSTISNINQLPSNQSPKQVQKASPPPSPHPSPST